MSTVLKGSSYSSMMEALPLSETINPLSTGTMERGMNELSNTKQRSPLYFISEEGAIDYIN